MYKMQRIKCQKKNSNPRIESGLGFRFKYANVTRWRINWDIFTQQQQIVSIKM